MIAVAQDQLLPVCAIFRPAVEQAGLIEHQHPQAVAGIQQFGCRRVMAGPVGVDAHFL